jgi:hypothetical protein
MLRRCVNTSPHKGSEGIAQVKKICRIPANAQVDFSSGWTGEEPEKVLHLGVLLCFGEKQKYCR